MAKTTSSNEIVLLDDEIFNMMWLIDFLNAKGNDVLPTATADEASDILSKEVYRAAILDLNVPMSEALSMAAGKLAPVYQKYPGLFVARQARNGGYRDRQVIIYSVHRDPDVTLEAERLGCTYILKGRPRELKSEIMHVLSFDPTSDL